MSEDIGVKAPVTRLRRRLSVESEEVKSPAGTTTPTKKKGGRLATKPQLDLIEENDGELVPKRSTRKTAVKDAIESVEEKPMTPSRRSARIRSNTSILSETPQVLDSPRAKRAAARRTSQAGSDNDAPLTPARQTRRTRKDSTSSIDKLVDKTSNKTPATTEVIVEEKENNDNDDSNTKDESSNKTPKSRGSKSKKNSISKSPNVSEEEIGLKNEEDFNISITKENKEIHKDSPNSVPRNSLGNKTEKENDNPEKVHIDKSSENKVNSSLIENLDANPKKSYSILNKSTSAIEDLKSFKNKRHRTKSVSAIATIQSNDCNFLSDTEITKKKRKDKSLTLHSGDISFKDTEVSKKNKDNSITVIDTAVEGENHNVHVNDEKTKIGNTSKNSSINEASMLIEEPTHNSVPKTGWKKNIINQIQTENSIDCKERSEYISPIKCFENAPTKNLQSVVFIEDDSDSNACNNDIGCPTPHLDSEDQCVPVVNHDNQNDSNEKITDDNSYEPMDIDESIQQNTTIHTSIKNTTKTPNQEKKKQSLISMDLNASSNNISSNKLKRNSSLSSFESHNEKSQGESKSTLIISQIKDTSSTEIDEGSTKFNNKEILSKSINIPDKYKNKEAERRKLSLDYSTSTPLQQKSMKKLGVPMDTSLISPKNGRKSEIDNENSKVIKENFNKSKNNSHIESDDDSEQSDESEAEVTKTQNEIIDDEAEEASEDYQSGDSQDEDERQYEEDNEIVEKGETLDTEEEFSDDTDYEKDSFVVSSDDDDNDLLSGSGDDLSMSDNELSMSAKSKKKYNEKKNKEQKKASREMYEARHKLDKSDKKVTKPKTKKNNRQRLDSSSSDSEEEVDIQPKKINRQRIDSSQDLDDTQLDDNEPVLRKKKQKCLSESVSDDNALDEKEMTICNNTKMMDKDPISVSIKHEPKTPQKHNLSAVVINDNIEEINVDQNASIMKPTETSDPLEATMLEVDENSSASEDNVEIMKNYNSVLENLNCNPKEIKKHDISLNINKKQKNIKEPIVDQLNLTHTKTKKNKKKTFDVEAELVSEKQTQKVDKDKVPSENEDDDVSDSINMRLLFTEDSNDSVNTDNGKVASANNTSKTTDYIPLKKTEAKTNLLEDLDNPTESNISLHVNESKKKNKKQRSSQIIPEENIPSNEAENNEASFFIDTIGAKSDTEEQMSTSLNTSSKKKKRNSEIVNNAVDTKESQVLDEEVELKKTPKKSLDHQINVEITSTEEPADVFTTQSAKKKKKGKKSLNVTEVEEIVTDEMENTEGSFFIDTTGNRDDAEDQISILNTSSKKKKRKSESNSIALDTNQSPVRNDEAERTKTTKKSLDNQIHAEIIPIVLEEPVDVSTKDTPQSGKKKKKGKESANAIEDEIIEIEDEIVTEEPIVTPKTPQSGKKKNKTSLSVDQPKEINIIHDTEKIDQNKSFETKAISDKKKKKGKKSLNDTQNESQDSKINDIPSETTQHSNKKGKSIQSNTETYDIIPLELNNSDDDDGPPLEIFKSYEKNKSGLEAQQTSENLVVNDASLNTSKNSAKKRKRKHSAANYENISLEGVKEKCEDNQLNESLAGSQKKKRKLNNDIEQPSIQDKGSTSAIKEINSVENNGPKLKKNKHIPKKENIQIVDKDEKEKDKRNKKRKDRDDDETTNVSKMFKQNSVDKAQVSRLPSYILNQLGDKPNKTISAVKRAKVIATTKFAVEDAKMKRNKPSNYLEESVYLNDDSLIEKQKKCSIKKPKVLPFIPTASTSDSGFTTNFRINILPRETQFVAKATDVINFKKDFLQQQKMKKFHTFEKYKNQRNVKLSKF